jgi:hypothetical protein
MREIMESARLCSCFFGLALHRADIYLMPTQKSGVNRLNALLSFSCVSVPRLCIWDPRKLVNRWIGRRARARQKIEIASLICLGDVL